MIDGKGNTQAAATVAACEHLGRGKVLPHCTNLEQAMESFKEAIEIADVLVPGRDNLLFNPLRRIGVRRAMARD